MTYQLFASDVLQCYMSQKVNHLEPIEFQKSTLWSKRQYTKRLMSLQGYGTTFVGEPQGVLQKIVSRRSMPLFFFIFLFCFCCCVFGYIWNFFYTLFELAYSLAKASISSGSFFPPNSKRARAAIKSSSVVPINANIIVPILLREWSHWFGSLFPMSRSQHFPIGI